MLVVDNIKSPKLKPKFSKIIIFQKAIKNSNKGQEPLLILKFNQLSEVLAIRWPVVHILQLVQMSCMFAID